MEALVLSRNVAIYSTRRLTEAFRARGAAVAVHDPASLLVRIGPEGLLLTAAGRPLRRPSVAVPRIGTAFTEHALAVLRHLEAAGVPTTASAAAIRVARDKMATLQALAAAGLPVPRTALAREPEDAAAAVAAVGGPPVVLKLAGGTHGVGVLLAESVDAATTVLQALWELGQHVLVQRFEASAAGRDLRLLVVGDAVVAAIRRHGPPGSFRANLHGGGRAEALDPPPEAVDLALRAARAVRIGVAGVDLLETDDGLLLTEVNGSPGLEGIEDATRVDVAAAIAAEALRLAER